MSFQNICFRTEKNRIFKYNFLVLFPWSLIQYKKYIVHTQIINPKWFPLEIVKLTSKSSHFFISFYSFINNNARNLIDTQIQFKIISTINFNTNEDLIRYRHTTSHAVTEKKNWNYIKNIGRTRVNKFFWKSNLRINSSMIGLLYIFFFYILPNTSGSHKIFRVVIFQRPVIAIRDGICT